MTAYISIGTTNSGNQERQGFLMQNEDKFLQQGYIYPKSLRMANRHWVLVDMVLELVKKDKLSQNPLDDLEDERLIKAVKNFKVEAEMHKDKKFIFSAEGIVWDFSTKRHIEILKSILNALGFDEIYEIIYFRDTLGYLNSHCSQDIKNNMGFYSADFKPDEHPRKYIFDYKWICESHIEVFGEKNLIVRLLKEEYVGGSLLKDFAYHLGLKWDDEFSLKQNKNESFNLLGMELQGRLIKKDLHGQNINSLLYIARKIFEGANEDRLKFRVQKEIAKAYVDYYAPSLEWVRARYFPHRKYLFEPINWDEYKENPTLIQTKESDWDKIADFIAEIIVSKNKIIQSLREE